MQIPPRIELKTNFSIFFNGKIKILPKIKIKQMHAKYVIILVSIIIQLPTKAEIKIFYANRNC